MGFAQFTKSIVEIPGLSRNLTMAGAGIGGWGGSIYGFATGDGLTNRLGRGVVGNIAGGVGGALAGLGAYGGLVGLSKLAR